MSPTTLASGITSNPSFTAVNSTAVYWVNGATLMKIAK
jgi:hypothetical protein